MRCPHCRAQIFTNERTLGLLKFATAGKAYHEDSPFDDWGNHDRACADLDKYLAEDNAAIMVVDSALLGYVWNDMLEKAKLKSAQSTPLHLQPARRPEVKDLTTAVLETLQWLDGEEVEMTGVYMAIMHNVEWAFCQKLRAT